jgi:hypothetical protein
MKKLSSVFLLFASILFLNLSANAQKVVVESGNLDFLKGQTALKIDYNYDNMGVGKFKTESEYVNQKVSDYNTKEAGKGDKWKEGWINARKDRYAPKFEELINKELEKSKVSVLQTNTTAKYTLIVKTTFIEPGFNVGVMKQPAFVDMDYIFVETANPSVVLAKLYGKKFMGAQAMGFDYDAGSRIAESYAKSGKVLGKYLAGKAFAPAK